MTFSKRFKLLRLFAGLAGLQSIFSRALEKKFPAARGKQKY
jgi:hypothetical protein